MSPPCAKPCGFLESVIWSKANLVRAPGEGHTFVFLDEVQYIYRLMPYIIAGAETALPVALHSFNFGTVTSLVITGADMKYWSDTQDRTGGSFFYMIKSADGSAIIHAATELIWIHSSLGWNDFQGIYFYTMRSGNFTATKKFFLMK